MKYLLILIFVSINMISYSQKKVVPASQSASTGILLPRGSKQDSRMFTVISAQVLLDEQGKKAGTGVKNPEIYYLPSVGVSGYNTDSLMNAVRLAGWIYTPDPSDIKYGWLKKSNRNMIVYFSTDKNETNFYLAECDKVPGAAPTPSNPVNAAKAPEVKTQGFAPTVQQQPNQPQQMNTGSQVVNQPTANTPVVPPPVNNPPVIPKISMSENAVFNGYTYSTTNNPDGWNALVMDDYVQVSKGSTVALIHFGINMTDDARMDIPGYFWEHVAAPKYTVQNLYPTVYSVLKDFPYHFIQADATEKKTGRNVFVSFQVIIKNGVAYCYEMITDSKASFQQQFPTMDFIEGMSKYNSFALGANDLIGTWQEGGGAFTQYYYVSSGNYAGMNITVSNLKYIFLTGSNYRTDVKAVSNNTYATEKEVGNYSVSNWEVSTTDQNGKISNFNAWFEAVKGGRLLHLQNKRFTSEQFQLGRVR
ncbi:MAG: hypothetical protein GZ094_11920 [Mariniphaga sp.]|nr:hypothetical protein [Mariniphaga sp.]